MASPNDEAYERRREQVRRAQKSHRARKATYVKQLESEVSDLRKQNASQLDTIRQLRLALLANGVSDPTDANDVSNSNDLATIELSGQKFSNQEVFARLPASSASGRSWSESTSPQAVSDSRSPLSNPKSRSDQDLTPASQAGALQTVTPTANNSSIGSPQFAHPQGLDSSQVAISWILSLERPCFLHHKTPSPELLVLGNIGNGHKAMISAPIMERSPSFSLNPLNLGFPADSQWTVPASELEQLLHVSYELGLTGEITPVQGWQMIRKHEKFNRLTFEQLDQLRTALAPLVECHGFGAVIDSVRFEEATHTFFSLVQAEPLVTQFT